MVPIKPISIDWVMLLVNGYAPQAQEAAGGDAVTPERVNQDQPLLASRVTGEDKRRIAGDLWPVFGSPSLDEQVAAFDGLLAASPMSPHVNAAGRLTWSIAADDPVDGLAASCIVSVLEGITTHGWTRLGTCAGCDCADVYIDSASRGRPRKYCSATCLNRANVRAFRSRQATA